MNRNNIIVVLSLTASLFVYLFYRTKKTIVVSLALHIISEEYFQELRHWIRSELPLNDFVIYSLPEGLWVMAATIMALPFIVEYKRYVFKLMYIPLLFSVGLEILQLLNITRGRFDTADIVIVILSWFMAIIIGTSPSHTTIYPFTLRGVLCLLVFSLVYLSHVCQ